jgi:hypothetical protein
MWVTRSPATIVVGFSYRSGSARPPVAKMGDRSRRSPTARSVSSLRPLTSNSSRLSESHALATQRASAARGTFLNAGPGCSHVARPKTAVTEGGQRHPGAPPLQSHRLPSALAVGTRAISRGSGKPARMRSAAMTKDCRSSADAVEGEQGSLHDASRLSCRNRPRRSGSTRSAPCDPSARRARTARSRPAGRAADGPVGGMVRPQLADVVWTRNWFSSTQLTMLRDRQDSA